MMEVQEDLMSEVETKISVLNDETSNTAALMEASAFLCWNILFSAGEKERMGNEFQPLAQKIIAAEIGAIRRLQDIDTIVEIADDLHLPVTGFSRDYKEAAFGDVYPEKMKELVELLYEKRDLASNDDGKNKLSSMARSFAIHADIAAHLTEELLRNEGHFALSDNKDACVNLGVINGFVSNKDDDTKKRFLTELETEFARRQRAFEDNKDMLNLKRKGSPLVQEEEYIVIKNIHHAYHEIKRGMILKA